MNKEEFLKLYPTQSQKMVVEVRCNCGKENDILKEKALDNIEKHGDYTCASCVQTGKKHTDETKAKISQSKLRKPFSDETKKKMSESRTKMFQTEKGIALRKKLSKYTALQNATVKLDKSKRRGIFHSTKNNKLVVYHSSYELRLCWLLEHDDNVVSYETQIFYEVEDRPRCLDFLIVHTDGSKKAIEVKPLKRMREQIHINQTNDSRTNAQTNEWGFAIYTEDDLGLRNSYEITKWADELRTLLGEENYVEFRKFRARQRAIKHYRKVIAENKVAVWCDYCEAEHTPLKLTYDKNIAAHNGEYWCESKAGSVGGLKPKLHLRKENPYASEGKKKCLGECQGIKLFEYFGLDKSRDDGYADRCKVCRNKKAKQVYREKAQN